ncbi:MAG TPA: zf-HC2 domain-containing protein [Terriglobales bacterium]|nr:zf-HC2 domain-containing protein [Terriglobales bacterium]
MNCTETRWLLSLYLDGAVTGRQMCDVGDHLANCRTCATEYDQLKQTQRIVSALGRRQPPPELALRIRVAISREAARQQRPRFEGLLTRLDNAIKGFMVPATAGMLSAIIFFGLLIGFFAMPQQLEASDSDVPTMLYTPPELTLSPFGWEMSAINADSLVVDVYVDSSGRVQDYKIVTAPPDAKEILPQLNNMLIFTVFRPATSFGQPISGRALLSFSKINVKG